MEQAIKKKKKCKECAFNLKLQFLLPLLVGDGGQFILSQPKRYLNQK